MMTNLLQKHWEWQEERTPYAEAWQRGADRQCTWQTWTSRRRSMRQDRGPRQKKMESHDTHGWFTCGPPARDVLVRGGRRCSNALRAISHSIGVSAKEALKLPDCDKRWPRSSLANVEETWTGKRMGILLDLEGANSTSEKQFYVGRQLLDYVPFLKVGQIRFAVLCGLRTSGCPFPKVTYNRCYET